MFVEPDTAFFQHFNDVASFVPVDPNEADVWLGASGNEAVEITNGYFKREPVFSDGGIVDARNTRLEYQMLTSRAEEIGLRKDTTLIIDSVKYRVGVTPSFSGHTHAVLSRTERRPR